MSNEPAYVYLCFEQSAKGLQVVLDKQIAIAVKKLRWKRGPE